MMVNALRFGFCSVDMFSRPIISHYILAGPGCERSR